MATKETTEEFKKDIEDTLLELKKHGYDRRQTEIEIGYAEFSLDQQVSKGGSKKLLSVLRILLKAIRFEETIDELKRLAQSQPLENYNEILARIDKNVKEIQDVNLVVYEHTLVNESLSQTLLSHSAHMESRHFRSDYDKTWEELSKVTRSIYSKLRGVADVGDQMQQKTA